MQHTSMNRGVDSESVRAKAYELWVKGGCRDGVAEQNWLEAEKILSSTEASTSSRATPVSQPSVPEAAAPVQVPEKPIFKTAAKPNGSSPSRKR